MNILATGGAGYIGSHTAKALAAEGHNPVTYDNFCRGHRWAVQWGPVVEGNLAETALLRRTLRQHRIDAVLHFAAFSSVGESNEKPLLYFENNVGGSLSLLEAMRAEGVRRIVFSSTCATYGNPVRAPIDESHPQNPVNPYGESKRAVERMLDWWGRTGAIDWVTLRYFNAAGADPDGDTGECHDPETHLIPLVLEAAIDPERPVHIFGADYPTPDGTCVRDYVHVTDLADAHIRALGYLESGGASRAFNLGSGRGVSVSEIIHAAREVTGREVAVVRTGRRAGDPPELIADAQDAQRLLGWSPIHSGLRRILETAWKWRAECLPSRAATRGAATGIL